MLSYTHITLEERKYLQKLLKEGYGIRQAAYALGRSPSTISREIKRNRSAHPRQPSDNPYNYHHWRAQNLATTRRRDNRRTALPQGSFKYRKVVEGLSLYWSPEQIAMRLRKDYPGQIVGAATIYRYLKRGELIGFDRKTHLRRRGKRKVNRNSNCNTIQPDHLIIDWPSKIKNRRSIGHFEGDSVLGKSGTGGILTFVDRESRFLFATKISSKAAEPTQRAIVRLFSDVRVKSISFDNGCEFARFRELEKELNITVYFAEPHKPWQRGTNENTNDLLRFFFPKGFDFRTLSEEELQRVVDLINNRPRKCLNWNTPAEVFRSLSVALD